MCSNTLSVMIRRATDIANREYKEMLEFPFKERGVNAHIMLYDRISQSTDLSQVTSCEFS